MYNREYHGKVFMIKKMRKIFFIFACLLFVSTFVLSCNRTNNDPFTTTDNTAESNVDNETAKDNTANATTDIFYAMSTKDAYEKYGMLSFSYDSNNDLLFDGKYKYNIYGLKNDKGESSGTTLGRIEYPDGTKYAPVCSDPLCNHLSSSCPLYGCNSSKTACYGGKIYFVTSDGNLCSYNVKTNKRELLKNGCETSVFYKYNDNLYFNYSVETENFNHTMFFSVITSDGSLTELGQLNDYNSLFGIVYEDKYYIDYEYEITNENKAVVSVLKRNVQTGAVSTFTKIDCMNATSEFESMSPYMLYGDMLLVRIDYQTKNENTASRDRLTEMWYIDLKTGEKRLLCTPDVVTYGTANARCLYSQKCIIWPDVRKKESDPFIINVIFPFTGEEKVFDISKCIYDAVGEIIPSDVYTTSMKNSALVLKSKNDGKSQILYEVDLENGNVRKNDVG